VTFCCVIYGKCYSEKLKKKEDSILTCLVGLQYISKMKKKGEEMYFHLLIIIIVVDYYYYYYYDYDYDFHLFIWGGHSSQYYASNDLSFRSETSACRTIPRCGVFKI